MKRRVLVLLCSLFVLLIAGVGCNGSQTESASSAQPSPTETEPALETVANQTVTLQLSIRDEPFEGVYSGEVLEGLPHGEGSFTTHDADGEEWVYIGGWNQGHMEGQGEKTWSETNRINRGTFKNDRLHGQGQQYAYTILRLDGVYENGDIVEGKMYDLYGMLYYEGAFTEGLRAESEEAKQLRIAAYEQEALSYDSALADGLRSHMGEVLVMSAEVNAVVDANDTREILELYIPLADGSLSSSYVTYFYAWGDTPHAAGDMLRVYTRVYDLSQQPGQPSDAFGQQALAITML